MIGDRVHQRRRKPRPFHQADLHWRQRRKAVCGCQNLHARPKCRFRQNRNGHAGKDRSRNDGRRPAGEQNLIFAPIRVQCRTGKLPPQTVTASDRKRHRRIVLQRMVGGCNPAQRFRPHHIRDPLPRVMGHECDIEFAPRHLFAEADRWFTDDIEFHIRMGLGEPADDFRHVAVGIIVGSADPDRALQPIVVERSNRLIVQPDDAPGVVHQLLALGGQAVAAPVLGKELLADPLFKPAHLHRHGRLCLEHPVRSLGEAARVDDGDESMQLVDIERSGHGRHPSVKLIIIIRNIRWTDQYD
ncbi:hypothetical protein D3C80_516110 [compost metagenome]